MANDKPPKPPSRNFFDEVASWIGRGDGEGARGRVARAFAVLGTAFAILQLLLSALDVANRAVAITLSWFRYLVPVVFIAGAAASVFYWITAQSVRQKRWAAGALALIVVAGGGWGSWTAWQITRPPKAVIIVVADFANQQEARRVDWGRRIYERVKDEVAVLQLTRQVDVVRVFESYDSAEQARAAGSARKATLVLWGWYDDVGVSPHFEVLRQAQQKLPANLVAPPKDLEDFDLYLRSGPQEMTYIVEVVLGLVHYTEGDFATAEGLFTRALNAAPPSAGLLGLEVPYFYRANARGFARQPIAGIVEDLQQAVTRKPDWFEAHWNLAVTYATYCAPARALDQAVGEAQKARDLKPNNADVYWLQGLLYSEERSWDDAQAAFRKAVQLNPDHVEAHEGLAKALGESGQTQAAQEAYARALELRTAAAAGQPTNRAEALDRMSYAQLNAGQYDQAIAGFREVLALAPDSADYHRHLGNALYWQGKSDAQTPSRQLDLAIAEYETARNFAPDDSLLLTVLGGAYQEAGRPADALKAYQAAVKASPCDDEALLLLANQYDVLGRPEEAEAAFRDLSQLNPRSTMAWHYLATAAFVREDYATAAQDYEAALKVEPESPDLLYGLGSSRYALADYRGAEEAYRQARALAPQDAGVLASWADSLSHLGQRDQAIAAYEQVVKLRSDQYLDWVSLGTLYEQAQRRQEALSAYERAAALKPDMAVVHAARGRVLQQLGQADAAASAFTQAVQYEPDNGYYWEALAMAQAAAGRPDEALKAVEETLRRNPASMRAYLVRAAVLETRGDRTGAHAAYQRGLELAGQDEQLKTIAEEGLERTK